MISVYILVSTSDAIGANERVSCDCDYSMEHWVLEDLVQLHFIHLHIHVIYVINSYGTRITYKAVKSLKYVNV